MVKIRRLLVPSTVAVTVTNAGKNAKRKICIHETGNRKIAANADAHARLQAKGNSRQASWHWTVDNNEAVQSFTHEARCWAAGTGQGNNEAIHIEICVNSDGNYQKAVDNAAQLTAKILKDEKLTISDVVQHNHYSGKNCPEIMRSGKEITWQQFLKMVEGYLQPVKEKEVRTMEFSSPALKNETETTLASAARRK
uniref:peptidoglycan recognition protein family protein n=1 Tax=Metasolibacillus meyeri TaxID=1071052 RepID=UPI00187D5086